MKKQNLLITAIISLFIVSVSFAAAPIFNKIGEERDLNSILFVVEGEAIEFTVTATDPDGDQLTYSAEYVPPWASFDSNTGVFTGTAPIWASDYDSRHSMPGIFDITFNVTDGSYTVSKIVSIYVLDLNWKTQTMRELIENRPITSGGEIGTSVALTNVRKETINTNFGGGKTLQKITFGFTSQVPDVAGWEDDWVSTLNFAFLPVNEPAFENVGAIIEGGYAQQFGVKELAERACAELNIPVLIIDVGWNFFYGGELMSKYHVKAVETGDPTYLFYAFATAHYLRALDALITVIETQTNWQTSYNDFKAVFTGHSKFGHTSICAAAADPNRIAGYMGNGCGSLDTGAARLLSRLQGAKSTKPEASFNYLGVMMRYYTESLLLENQMDPGVKALLTMGTDDDKDRSEGYTAKYILTVSENQNIVPNTFGCLPNAPHTTKSPLHATYWTMWLAHTLLGRPVISIDSIFHISNENDITVNAIIPGDTPIQSVQVWATEQSDLDTSSWNGFDSYPMSFVDGVYTAKIPTASKTYFVEVSDEAGGGTGMISSTPVPVDRDYPLIPQAPGRVSNFTAEKNSQIIDLSWENPVDNDFVGVIICYSTAEFPDSPLSGNVLYDDDGTSCSQPVSSENTIFYSAFTYDAMGNYSNSANCKIDGVTGMETESNSIPLHFNLLQNYPNPLNSFTAISYQLSADSFVELTIYNSTGQKICTLVNEQKSTGYYSVNWDGKDNFGKSACSGVYFYKLKTDNNTQLIQKMILLR